MHINVYSKLTSQHYFPYLVVDLRNLKKSYKTDLKWHHLKFQMHTNEWFIQPNLLSVFQAVKQDPFYKKYCI